MRVVGGKHLAVEQDGVSPQRRGAAKNIKLPPNAGLRYADVPLRLLCPGAEADERAEAKAKLAQAERLEADLREQLKEARLQSQKLVVEAEQESERLYREAMALAQADSNGSREQARREIDSQRTAALDQLRGDADQLADLIVDRLLAAS